MALGPGPGTNRNRKSATSEPFLQQPKTLNEPEPWEPLSRIHPCLSIQTLLKYRETPSPKEPSKPKTGTARTVPCTNRNRTEPWPPLEKAHKGLAHETVKTLSGHLGHRSSWSGIFVILATIYRSAQGPGPAH